MDSVSKDVRSRIMRSVKSKRTKFEKDFYKALVSAGSINIEWNPSGIFGNPDFASKDAKVAIFLDSCFWHGCSRHFRLPSSNIEYWATKIERNKKRDKYVTRTLMENGWKVIRIWEHALLKHDSLEKWANKVSKIVLEKQAVSIYKRNCQPDNES